MKTLHKFNKYALSLTLLLYITVYFGMLAQILLGALQLIIAIIIMVKHYRKLPIRIKLQFKMYWLLVAIASLMLAWVKFYDPYFSNDFYMMVTLFVFPMAIACYFVYLTNNIRKELP